MQNDLPEGIERIVTTQPQLLAKILQENTTDELVKRTPVNYHETRHFFR